MYTTGTLATTGAAGVATAATYQGPGWTVLMAVSVLTAMAAAVSVLRKPAKVRP